MRASLFIAVLLWSCIAQAAEPTLRVCFNWGCASETEVTLPERLLQAVSADLALAVNAADERRRLAVVVGWLYIEAGRQAPVSADRGGNDDDAESVGRMDCIDHSTTTLRVLQLLEGRGALRFHQVIEAPVFRAPLILNQHFSAAIREVPGRPWRPMPDANMPDHIGLMLALCGACEEVYQDVPSAAQQQRPSPGGVFVVDTWFRDHGRPAVVLPLSRWKRGEGGRGE